MTEYLLLFLSPLAPDTLTLCPPNLKTKQFKVSTWAGGNKGSPGKGRGGLGRLVRVNERFGMLSPFIGTHQIRERKKRAN